jgi:hypothetical protein
MTLFSFKTTIPIVSTQKIIIRFDYFLPEQFALWEDRYNGSIKILDVIATDTLTPLPSFSIEAQIALRRTCWDYLENNHLFYTHNVEPLPFHTTKNVFQ